MLMPLQERSRADPAVSAGFPPAPPVLWWGGVCSEQGSPLKHWRVIWPRLSLSFLVRRVGPRAGFSVGSLWASPVPGMSPEVTSSYLCDCIVSPQPLPLSPIFIVLWEVPQKTSYRQAPTTSGRTKTNRKRICVWGPKRYRVGQKFHSGLSQRSEQNFWPAYNVQGEIRIVVNSFCCFRMWVCILSVSSPWHTWPLEACICSVDLPTPPCVPALLTPVSAPGPSPSSRGWVSPVAPTSPSLCLGQLEQPPPLPSNSSCLWFRSWVWGNLPPLLRYFP